MNRTKIAFACVFFAGFLAFADFNTMNVPDSAQIRRECAQRWFYEDLSVLRQNHVELHSNEIGQEFQIRLEETDSSFAVIVAPKMLLETDFYTENGIERRTVDDFPGDACGAWILFRNSVSGKGEKLRIYFSANSGEYVEFESDENKTLADFVICGLYAAKGVPVGIPFEKLYEASFQQILLLTEHSLPWNYADTQKGQFDSKLQMIGVIRKNLGRIFYSEDSCYNENGESIRISDGKKYSPEDFEDSIIQTKIENPLFVDSAGFLKWIADGLVVPVNGSFLYRDPLMVKTVSYDATGRNGVLGQTMDISFALDWCRNLSAACLSVKSHKKYMWDEANMDVQIDPFASEVSSGAAASQIPGFIKDSGYSVKMLKPLLYVLASSEPAYFYLAAIKRPVKEVYGNAENFIFDQCAAIFPMYDKDGKFACVVFENGRELTLNQFVSKYEGCYIHLSRVLSEKEFYPQ